MEDVRTEIIGNKIFELRVPVRKQVIEAYQLMKKYEIDVDALLKGEKESEEDTLKRAKELAFKVNFTDFGIEFPAVALIEKGKSFTQSFVANKDAIVKYYADSEFNPTEMMLVDFFGLMAEATSPAKEEKAEIATPTRPLSNP